MYIESLIRPSKGNSRIVTVNGASIEFSRVAKDRFVALVEDPAAQQTLLQHKHLFREFTDQAAALAAAPKLSNQSKPAAPPAAQSQATSPTPSAPHAPPDAGDDASQSDEITAAAQALLASTPVAIKKQVERHQPTKAVLERALEIEQGEKNPRQQIVALLKAHLSSLAA